jgi:hypothetical protein
MMTQAGTLKESALTDKLDLLISAEKEASIMSGGINSSPNSLQKNKTSIIIKPISHCFTASVNQLLRSPISIIKTNKNLLTVKFQSTFIFSFPL